jgi:hypothetical protein
MLIENFNEPVFPGKKNPVHPEKFRVDRYSINGIKLIIQSKVRTHTPNNYRD